VAENLRGNWGVGIAVVKAIHEVTLTNTNVFGVDSCGFVDRIRVT
jgi:hypothetical protein